MCVHAHKAISTGSRRNFLSISTTETKTGAALLTPQLGRNSTSHSESKLKKYRGGSKSQDYKGTVNAGDQQSLRFDNTAQLGQETRLSVSPKQNCSLKLPTPR